MRLNENKEKGYTNIVFKVMGDGVLKADFEKFALDNNIKPGLIVGDFDSAAYSTLRI